MPISVTPASPAIGAVVDGLDLSRALDDRAKAVLQDAFYKHCMVLIRGQNLTQDQLVAATTWLGTISKRNRPDAIRREDNPYISKVSNIRENGELIGSLPDGEMFFHFDAAYVERPQRATFLYSVEVPSVGGNTLFANMYKAYDNVPASLKARLEGKTALQVYDYTTIEKPDIANRLSELKHFSHPVFITHPVTKRKALYISRLMTARINEMEESESNEILEELYAYAEDPQIQYEHVWRQGDFIAWDNLCSSHARTDFSAAERRLLLRGVMEGNHRPTA
jgi:taurine dioxygenase